MTPDIEVQCQRKRGREGWREVCMDGWIEGGREGFGQEARMSDDAAAEAADEDRWEKCALMNRRFLNMNGKDTRVIRCKCIAHPRPPLHPRSVIFYPSLSYPFLSLSPSTLPSIYSFVHQFINTSIRSLASSPSSLYTSVFL